MSKTLKASKTLKPRDGNILKGIKGEISLKTRSITSKEKYSRKVKHKEVL